MGAVRFIFTPLSHVRLNPGWLHRSISQSLTYIVTLSLTHCDVSLFPLTSFFSLIVSLVLFVSLTDSFSLLLIAYDSFARCLSQSLTRSLPSPHTRYLSHTAQSHALPLSRMTPLTRCICLNSFLIPFTHRLSFTHCLSQSLSYFLSAPLSHVLSLIQSRILSLSPMVLTHDRPSHSLSLRL